MIIRCDGCGREHPIEERFYSCAEQPNDSTSLYCIAYFCTQCTEPSKHCNTLEALEDYIISDEAIHDGYIFLEI